MKNTKQKTESNIMESTNMDSRNKMIKINRLLIGRYRIAQPQETNNSYYMDNRNVPSTYTNLTEPEISNICNLGGNILTPVIRVFSNNKVISHTDIKHHNKWAIRLNP